MTLIFLTNASNSVFLTTTFFTTLLIILKSFEAVSNSSISNLLISDFKLAKSPFLAKFDVSVALLLNQILLHN